MAPNDSRATVPDLQCIELVEVITDYFEGRLSDEDRVRFDVHLLGCEGCTTYVEQMHETIRLVGTLTEEDVPPEARQALLAAFRVWKHARRA